MKKPSNKFIIMSIFFLLILSLVVGPGRSFSSSVPTDNSNKSLPMKEVLISMKGINEAGFRVESYSFGVTQPRDHASGQATGKRQHKPFTFTKPIDSSSPILYKKLLANEAIPEVLLRVSEPGTKNSLTIKLTNASLMQIEQKYGNEGNQNLVEEISFVYEKIEMTFNDSKGVTTTVTEDRVVGWSFNN